LPPDDVQGGLRRHKRGLKCKKGREVVSMNAEGYHVMNPNGNGYWNEILRPFMREVKFYKYFPAPIVSFIRWKSKDLNCLHRSRGANALRSKEFLKELEQFLKLSEQQQIAYLEGAILEWEYKHEKD